jgi:hypothetical protein
MRLFRTEIPTDDGARVICDTIQHDGKLWLAPEWLEDPAKPYSKPVRLIGLSALKYRSIAMSSRVDFVLDQPVPVAVLQGQVPRAEAAPFVILEHPDIRVPNTIRIGP